MANAFSIPANMGTWVDPINEGLINQVLSSKDKKYDYNVAKIDNLIQQYTNIPLAREQDKEYLKNRLDTLVNTVNNSVKLDMSNSNTERQIEQTIGTAIDDRVLEQAANTSSIMNFEQTVAQKREKKPELYDDRNYTVAKKRAGVDAYLSGATDKVGTLRYDDYYDVDANLTKELEDWAKGSGFTKNVTEEGNAYFIRKETKEELTPQQIENFYNTKIQADPKLQTQMSINSDYQFGGMDDSQFRESYISSVKDKKQEITSVIAKINEAKKNFSAGDERIAQADEAISSYNEVVTNYDREINNPNFNRQQKQFEIYSGSLLNNYKKTYAKSEVTAIDYDDTPMKIAKFEMEVAKDAREKAEAAGVGTPFNIDTKLEENKEDVFTQQEKAFTGSFQSIDSYLKANNPEYAKGNTEARKAIRDQITINISKQDIGAKGYPKEFLVIADNYIQQSRIYTKVKQEVNKNIDVEIETYFNGMKTDKEKISLSNLSGTLPSTSKLLADERVKNFKDLTKDQQNMVKLEMANNLKTFVAKDPLEKKFLTNYSVDIEKTTGLKYNNAKTEQPGLFESAGNVIAGGLKATAQLLIGSTYETVKNLFNSENMEVGLDNQMKYVAEDVDQMKLGLTGLVLSNNRIISPDQNLSEISSRQINLKAGESLKDRWGASYRAVEDMTKNSLKSVESTLNTNTGYSYNPNIKAQKPITDALQSIAFAQGYSPVKDAPYRVQLSPDRKTATIMISNTDLAINSKGKQTKTVSEDVPIQVPIEQLPKSILDNLDLSQANWTYDFRNQTQFKKTHQHKVFNTSDQRDEFLENFNENNPGTLSQAEYYNIISNPQSTPLKTTQDYDKILINYQNRYGLSGEAVMGMKQNIIDNKYFVEYERVPNQGFLAKVKKGEGNNSTEVQRFRLDGVSYDPSTFTMNSFRYIDQAIQNQLQEYARQHSK
jgi:hypothetical protein